MTPPVEVAAWEFARRGWSITGDTQFCIASKFYERRRSHISAYRRFTLHQAKVEISQPGLRGPVRFRVLDKRSFPIELYRDYRKAIRKAEKAVRKAARR